jgi:hypothetical protein
MKILLACLMCLVLTASECFAISGGPVFGGGRHVAIPGIYAGVLVPLPIIIDPGPPPVTLKDNSLVLFTLIIPKVGLARGTVAVFRNGFFYQGTIQGSADFDTGRLIGVVNATVAEIGGTANGRFVNTRIKASRISGKASIAYRNDAGDPAGDSGGPIFYSVRGFKQAKATG